jgi:hypothetical protein
MKVALLLYGAQVVGVNLPNFNQLEAHSWSMQNETGGSTTRVRDMGSHLGANAETTALTLLVYNQALISLLHEQQENFQLKDRGLRMRDSEGGRSDQDVAPLVPDLNLILSPSFAFRCLVQDVVEVFPAFVQDLFVPCLNLVVGAAAGRETSGLSYVLRRCYKKPKCTPDHKLHLIVFHSTCTLLLSHDILDTQ